MKRPLLMLLTIMSYCSVGIGLAVPTALWFALKDTSEIDFLRYAFFGSSYGAACGIAIWLLYRFNLH